MIVHFKKMIKNIIKIICPQLMGVFFKNKAKMHWRTRLFLENRKKQTLKKL